MTTLVNKEWGCELWLVNEPQYCAKELFLQYGKQCSLHYHPVKKETFLVKEGMVQLQHGDKIEVLSSGDSRTIEPGTPHRFAAITDDAMILEISTHHDDADVVRIEPSGDFKGIW